jgi:hypothetical protein
MKKTSCSDFSVGKLCAQLAYQAAPKNVGQKLLLFSTRLVQSGLGIYGLNVHKLIYAFIWNPKSIHVLDCVLIMK